MKLRYLLILTAVLFSVMPLYAEFCRNCGQSEYFLQDGECVKCTMQKYNCSVCGENPAVFNGECRSCSEKPPCSQCGKKDDLLHGMCLNCSVKTPCSQCGEKGSLLYYNRTCSNCIAKTPCSQCGKKCDPLSFPAGICSHCHGKDLLKRQFSNTPLPKMPELPRPTPLKVPKRPDLPKHPGDLIQGWVKMLLGFVTILITIIIGIWSVFAAISRYLVRIIRKKRAAAKAAASDSAVTDFQRLDSGKFSGDTPIPPPRQNSTVQTGDIAAKSATGKKQQ